MLFLPDAPQRIHFTDGSSCLLMKDGRPLFPSRPSSATLTSCAHNNMITVSQDTNPPVVTDICPDCGWRFPHDGREPFHIEDVR